MSEKLQGEIPFEKRLFWKYARDHINEMRLLFRGGRLSKMEGEWNNVIDHCLTEGAAAEIISNLLGLSEEEAVQLQNAAFCHDWAKRLEIKPNEFNSEQKMKSEELLNLASPDSEIMAATNTGFSEDVLEGKSNFLQNVMFYIDQITYNSEIIGFEKRCALTEKRSELGHDYWETVRKASTLVENQIFKILTEKGFDLSTPSELSDFIKQKVIDSVRIK